MRSRRVVAAIAALWLVLARFAGAHHEAAVAHVTDAHGHTVHAAHMVGAHVEGLADIHAADGGDDERDCVVCATLHAPARPPLPGAALAVALLLLAIIAAPRAPDGPTYVFATYRVAPKTSPPPLA